MFSNIQNYRIYHKANNFHVLLIGDQCCLSHSGSPHSGVLEIYKRREPGVAWRIELYRPRDRKNGSKCVLALTLIRKRSTW